MDAKWESNVRLRNVRMVSQKRHRGAWEAIMGNQCEVVQLGRLRAGVKMNLYELDTGG